MTKDSDVNPFEEELRADSYTGHLETKEVQLDSEHWYDDPEEWWRDSSNYQRQAMLVSAGITDMNLASFEYDDLSEDIQRQLAEDSLMYSPESKASELLPQPHTVENGWVRTELGDVEIFDGRVLPAYRLSDPNSDGSMDMDFVDLPEGGRVNLSVSIRESKASEDYEEDKETIEKLLKKNGSVTFDDFLAQYGDYPQSLESKANEVRHLSSKQKSLIKNWVNDNRDSLSVFVTQEDLPYELLQEIESQRDYETLYSDISRYASDVVSGSESYAREYSIKEEYDLQDEDGKYEMLAKSDVPSFISSDYAKM